MGYSFDWVQEVQERGGCLYCMESRSDEDGDECGACYGTGQEMSKIQCYTIGAIRIYEDGQSPKYKGEGGSVWRNLDDVLEYFKKIEGKVMLMNEKVPASIYSIIVPRGWEQDTRSDGPENVKWRSLNTSALIIEKVEIPVDEDDEDWDW